MTRAEFSPNSLLHPETPSGRQLGPSWDYQWRVNLTVHQSVHVVGSINARLVRKHKCGASAVSWPYAILPSLRHACHMAAMHTVEDCAKHKIRSACCSRYVLSVQSISKTCKSLLVSHCCTSLTFQTLPPVQEVLSSDLRVIVCL